MAIQYLFIATRARVYLLWALLVPFGFVLTHLYRMAAMNVVWAVIAIIGLGYTYRVIPRSVRQLREIFLTWLMVIGMGMIVSMAVFLVDTVNAARLLGHLGVFWLAMMGLGYILNGLVDRPAGWYWFAAALNLIAAVLCWQVDAFVAQQHLVAAIVAAWSLTSLWLFRS